MDVEKAPAGWVHLACSDPFMDLLLPLAPDPPTFSEGFEGWEVEPRPLMDGATVWRGNTPLLLTFGVVFEGFKSKTSQESRIRDLIRVARGNYDNDPGIVSIDGIPGKIFDEWIIENVEFGDQIRRASDMHRVRQFCTVTLRQYIPPELISIKKKALRKPRGRTKVIKAKKGDTPAKIARRLHVKWTALRDLNKFIKKPHQHIKVGTKVRVPAKKSMKDLHKRGTNRPNRSRLR